MNRLSFVIIVWMRLTQSLRFDDGSDKAMLFVLHFEFVNVIGRCITHIVACSLLNACMSSRAFLWGSILNAFDLNDAIELWSLQRWTTKKEKRCNNSVSAQR